LHDGDAPVNAPHASLGRVEALIGRAKQRLSLHEQGLMTARQAAEWAATADASAGLDHRTDATCPACGATGLLEGQEVLSYEVNYERTYEEDYDVRVDLSVGSDYFSCPRCHLVLDGYELLDVAGAGRPVLRCRQHGRLPRPGGLRQRLSASLAGTRGSTRSDRGDRAPAPA
jgi:hypothetical protein